MLLRDVIQRKGNLVHSCTPRHTLQQVVELLAMHNIGSLVVLEGTRLVGIITERDILRAAASEGEKFGSQLVSECMTRNLITVTDELPVTEVMGLMTDHRIRHLPILTDGQLTGMVSIGDIVKAQHDSLMQENYHLKAYILS